MKKIVISGGFTVISSSQIMVWLVYDDNTLDNFPYTSLLEAMNFLIATIGEMDLRN